MMHEKQFNLFINKFKDSVSENSKKVTSWYVSRSIALGKETIQKLTYTLLKIEKEFHDAKYSKEFQYKLLKSLISDGVVEPYKDKGSIREGSALIRGYKKLLQTLGLLYVDDYNNIILTEIAHELINEKLSSSKIFGKQIDKLQYPFPGCSQNYEWFKEGISPVLFLIEILSKLKNNKISKNEFLLFINIANSMDDISQVIKWIKCWRDLNTSEKEKLLIEVKKIKKGENSKFKLLKNSFAYMKPFYCYSDYLEYNSDDEIILKIQTLKKATLQKLSQLKIPIYGEDEKHEWFQYYGSSNSKPNWLNYISLKLKQSSSLGEFKKSKDYKKNFKKLSKEEQKTIHRQQREKEIEDYYIKNLNDIEEGLVPFIALSKNREKHPSRQYPTATGPIDILCKDKDGNIVVVEIKVGDAEDAVFGQILRYIGFIKRNEGAESFVRGIILAGNFPDKAKFSRIGMPTEDYKNFITFRKHGFTLQTE